MWQKNLFALAHQFLTRKQEVIKAGGGSEKGWKKFVHQQVVHVDTKTGEVVILEGEVAKYDTEGNNKDENRQDECK